MAILTYIDGYPLFNSNKEARDYGESINIKGTHVHRYKKGPHNYRVGYMSGDTHEALITKKTPSIPSGSGSGGGSGGGGGY